MIRFSVGLAGAAVLAVAVSACASNPQPGQGNARLAFGEAIERPVIDALILADFDPNRDGRITLLEVESRVGAVFAAADANGDGQVGGLELRAFGLAVGGSAEAAPLLVAMDRNGDGAVRADEFGQYYAERVTGLDDDRNGVVSRAELVEEIAPLSRPRPEVVKEPS